MSRSGEKKTPDIIVCKFFWFGDKFILYVVNWTVLGSVLGSNPTPNSPAGTSKNI